MLRRLAFCRPPPPPHGHPSGCSSSARPRRRGRVLLVARRRPRRVGAVRVGPGESPARRRSSRAARRSSPSSKVRRSRRDVAALEATPGVGRGVHGAQRRRRRRPARSRGGARGRRATEAAPWTRSSSSIARRSTRPRCTSAASSCSTKRWPSWPSAMRSGPRRCPSRRARRDGHRVRRGARRRPAARRRAHRHRPDDARPGRARRHHRRLAVRAERHDHAGARAGHRLRPARRQPLPGGAWPGPRRGRAVRRTMATAGRTIVFSARPSRSRSPPCSCSTTRRSDPSPWPGSASSSRAAVGADAPAGPAARFGHRLAPGGARRPRRVRPAGPGDPAAGWPVVPWSAACSCSSAALRRCPLRRPGREGPPRVVRDAAGRRGHRRALHRVTAEPLDVIADVDPRRPGAGRLPRRRRAPARGPAAEVSRPLPRRATVVEVRAGG